MSLNWSIMHVKDHEELIDESRADYGGIDVVTEAVIWACMALGLSGPTKKNIDEFLYRQEFAWRTTDYHPMHWGTANAPEGKKPGSGRFFTREELERRIGLTTNVTEVGRAAFQKNNLRIVDEETRRALRLRKE